MMDRVEHEVPKKFHHWFFHYHRSLVKKLCASLLSSIIKRGNPTSTVFVAGGDLLKSPWPYALQLETLVRGAHDSIQSHLLYM